MPPRDAARPRKPRGPVGGGPHADFAIVAIGASAGGLGACMKMLAALPPNIGMAFLVVLHLEPNHESLLVELLGARTPMPVVQATDGMPIERDRVHVIPPGALLSVDAQGFLRLSKPPAKRGERLPFDYLLATLATAFAARVVCVILSGAGADGSLGLRAVKANGGLVLVQRSDEAEYDGMPSSAISTGEVDEVLGAAQIAARLVERTNGPASLNEDGGGLAEIVAYLREKTTHDFTLYKRGTLERHVARRMARASIASATSYLAWLRLDEGELAALSREVLINVTSFFRDASVFEYLGKDVVPALVRDHPADRTLRIWTAGCSSGEEAYSLAILFLEEMSAQKRDIKLQIFASDVDADAVGAARDGDYPTSIEADVTSERLKRFFSRGGRGYVVTVELRAHVVFTVHDVLADPPFAKLDMIACRNLLIYLIPEAQARVASLFHFALNPGGLLVLGNAEAMAADDDGFKQVSRSARLYRREAGARARSFSLSLRAGDGALSLARPTNALPAFTSSALAEHCRNSVLARYAPPSMLVNAKAECLYVQGATDRYLKVASGRPSNDAVGMAREGVATKLRLALETALRTKKRCESAVGRLKFETGQIAFKVIVEPAPKGTEDMYLVCFVEQPVEAATTSPAFPAAPFSGDADSETSRAELQSVVRNLEARSAQQVALNDEALLMNEEFQTKNEELMASKEELQSLNEELNALNSQLQETLERQRTLADDLQNVLYSTDVATIFLDSHLNIRFFTPATKALFHMIVGDIGRPLTDLKSFVPDGHLVDDVRRVLAMQTPLDREVPGQDGAWFTRRILPYRTRDLATEGVVITFADVTERRQTAHALHAAKRQAEQASKAKSRFLAAASHDLRQPLQTLALIQGLLAIKVKGVKEQRLIVRFEDALTAMTNMLNTLLDINLIEVGAIKVAAIDVPVADLLNRMRTDLTDQAQSQGLKLIVMPCSLSIRTDPPLLEQMLRNLLSNALKYTSQGRVLLGCRRRRGHLRIEVWDTGRGIPASELEAIFEEYHQIDNAARERSRGLGLGLSIVKSLGDLLEHPVRVRSSPSKGSVFSLEVPLSEAAQSLAAPARAKSLVEAKPPVPATILVVEDDPEVREYLGLFLSETGYSVESAADGPAALTLLAAKKLRPDLVLADYNLPNGLTGVELSRRVRRDLGLALPFIILTGDISTEALRDIARHDCVQFSKPVKLRILNQAIAKLLEAAPSPFVTRVVDAIVHAKSPKVFVVDDDVQIRGAVAAVLEHEGWTVEAFASCEAFLAAKPSEPGACLLLDAYLPGMSGLALLRKLQAEGSHLPAILMTGESDVAIAVEAMKAGAVDFIAKPVSREELLASLDRAMEISRDASKQDEWRATARAHLAGLTTRQIEVMHRVLGGQPSKNIAADLGISQRTVENHRMQIMKRTGCRSLPALARMALVAKSGDEADQIKPAA